MSGNDGNDNNLPADEEQGVQALWIAIRCLEVSQQDMQCSIQRSLTAIMERHGNLVGNPDRVNEVAPRAGRARGQPFVEPILAIRDNRRQIFSEESNLDGDWRDDFGIRGSYGCHG